jgi:predicted permease
VAPVARLRADVSLEAARARWNAIVAATADGLQGELTRPADARAGVVADSLRILMVAVFLLLLITCVNVSNLLLHRTAARARETAVRTALGAGRARLVRQFLLESLLLAISGAALGVALALAALRALRALAPPELRELQVVSLDGSVLLVALGSTLVLGVALGLLPALQGARTGATAALGRAPREGGGTSARLRWTLVAAEVGLSFALLAGASLLVGSVREMSTRDPGFEPAGLVAVDISLPVWSYGSNDARQPFERQDPAPLFQRLRTELAALPGVRAVALASAPPPDGGVWFGQLHPEGAEPERETTIIFGLQVGAGYMATVGQEVLAGREFTEEEVRGGASVILLGERTARRIFADGPAVGRTFRFQAEEPLRVVGVVEDARMTGLKASEVPLTAYWPMSRAYAASALVLRTDRAGSALAAEVRDIVRRAEPEALVEVGPVAARLGATLARERFTTVLVTTFATLAVLLAAVGLYGVLAQIVTGRTHEIGIRMSLGADRPGIRRLVLGTGARAVVAGLAAGTVLLVWGVEFLQGKLFGVTGMRPEAYGAAALLVTVVALAAMWLPASRAARVDPMTAMRAD